MPADHPLDRPIWQALTSRQADLNRGDGRVGRFDRRYAPFGAVADDSPPCIAALAERIDTDGVVVLIDGVFAPTPPGALSVRQGLLNQMVATHLVEPQPNSSIVPLCDDDAPEMLALATLTEPGPFLALTHRLGDFVGIKQNGALVAMAGERMKLEGYTEVSAVCTHPGHRGRGYGAALTGIVAARILARGETPFLHVFPDNVGAIAVYEALGFRLRRQMMLNVLTPGLAPG